MKTLGIVAHSAEGAALCFLTACREGAAHLGPHMHPKLAAYAVREAVNERPIAIEAGWLEVSP